MSRVNIIGAGLAGLSAALSLAENEIESNLISLQPSERAQSVMAEGGINAALDTMGESDSVQEHFTDTIKGGVDLADPEAVKGLTENAPDIVRALLRAGTPFQMNGEDLLLRNFGGQKKKRTAFAKSSTGKVIMSSLIDRVRRQEEKDLVHRYPHHEAVEPVIEEGVCKGVIVRDTFTDEILFLSGPVIVASGGLNGLFEGMTTGSTANSGDFSAACFEKGVTFGNLEMIQYHPTTAAIPGKRLLISEAARGEGGRLFIKKEGKQWYFMEDLSPEMGNLAPRDVVSRTMNEVVRMDDTQGRVCLDMTGLSKNIWKDKLSDMREEIINFLNIDPAKSPVPVSPGIHFFMGGILTDKNHRTSIKGLYAAGECACQYHGANRLGGNSMLGAIYGGKVAAGSAAQDRAFFENADTQEKSYDLREVSAHFTKDLTAALREGLGIMRNAESINAALGKVKAMRMKDLNAKERRRLNLAEGMLICADERKESRGAHTRTDFPERDDEHFQRTSVAQYDGNAVKTDFKESGMI